MDLIGPLQIRIMHYLWSNGPSTVHTVHDALNAQAGARALVYTTVLTVMRNLAKRGLLSQAAGGRAHIFAPTIDERSYKVRVLRDLRHQLFAEDIGLMLHLLSADEELPAPLRERLAAIAQPTAG